jgi:hypothetical protein
MSRLAKAAFFPLVLTCVSLGQIKSTPDPAELLQQAKALLAPGQTLDSDVLLVKVPWILGEANEIWAKSSSTDPRYAESLDLLAIVLRRGRGLDTEHWRTLAAPLVGPGSGDTGGGSQRPAFRRPCLGA